MRPTWLNPTLALTFALAAPAVARAAPEAPHAPAAAKPARSAEAIIAEADRATGGPAAWSKHKNMHIKLQLSFQGMGISGSGERYSTSTDKSLTVTDVPGIGTVREGSNGTVFWSEDPVNGLRRLEGAEAEEARVESAWNPEQRLKDFYPKVEATTEPGPSGAPLECVVLTPKLGKPVTDCYDPATHLQVLQKGLRATPQGDTPYSSTFKNWHTVGGVKIPFDVDTQAGPITFATRTTDVRFDEVLDDKMFEAPVPPAPPPDTADQPAEKPPGKGKAKPKH